MNTLAAKINKTRYGTVLALLGLGLIAGEASATLVLATHNIHPQTNAAAANLDLDGNLAGIQPLLRFSTTLPNQLVRVIFNAEATIGGGAGNWLDATIFIDNVACAPSDSENALVSGNGTATQHDAWVSVVTQCFVRIPNVGLHTVRVLVTPNPANTAWRIDDLSLVIDR